MVYPIENYVNLAKSQPGSDIEIAKTHEDEENCYALFMTLSLPFPLTNRNSVFTMYNHLEDGNLNLCFGEGNDQILEEYKDKIGSNVICEMRYAYTKFGKNDNGKGFFMWKTACFDLKGSIPTAISNMLMRQGFGEMEMILGKIRKGEM